MLHYISTMQVIQNYVFKDFLRKLCFWDAGVQLAFSTFIVGKSKFILSSVHENKLHSMQVYFENVGKNVDSNEDISFRIPSFLHFKNNFNKRKQKKKKIRKKTSAKKSFLIRRRILAVYKNLKDENVMQSN